MIILTSNSRRDGSPFVNLLMIAPLCDSRGQIRYHIGAQVDVSGLVKDCTDLESFQQLVMGPGDRQGLELNDNDDTPKKDEFQEVRNSPIQSLRSVAVCGKSRIRPCIGLATRLGMLRLHRLS